MLFPGNCKVPWVGSVSCPGQGSCAQAQRASQPHQRDVEEANSFVLVQAVFPVPTWRSVTLWVASGEMFAGRAALEIV